MHTLTHRSLTPEESLLLHEELKTTPNIFGYTVQELPAKSALSAKLRKLGYYPRKVRKSQPPKK